jgi:hypothetical protein
MVWAFEGGALGALAAAPHAAAGAAARPPATGAAAPPCPRRWLSCAEAHAALLAAAAALAAPLVCAPAAAAGAACSTAPLSPLAPPHTTGAAAAAALLSALEARACSVAPGALFDALWLTDDAHAERDDDAAAGAALLSARDAHGDALAVTLLALQSADCAEAEAAGDGGASCPFRDIAHMLSARLLRVRLPPAPKEKQRRSSGAGGAGAAAAAAPTWGQPVALAPPPPRVPLLLDAGVLWRGALCFPEDTSGGGRGGGGAAGGAAGGAGAGGGGASSRPLRGRAALAQPLEAVLSSRALPARYLRYEGLQLTALEAPVAAGTWCASCVEKG